MIGLSRRRVLSALVTLWQSTVPQKLLGRVTAVYRTITRGGRPLGALLGGIVATTFSLQSAFIVLGIATALLVLPLALVLRHSETD
ncbi:MFS transporter [Arthrobacter sp. TMN-50]